MNDILKQVWQSLMDNDDKYIVLAIDDILKRLNDTEIQIFNTILEKIIDGRVASGKSPLIQYKKKVKAKTPLTKKQKKNNKKK